MHESIYLPLRTLKKFLDEVSEIHGDVLVDIDIIDGIVKGWKQGRSQDQKQMADALRRMAEGLDSCEQVTVEGSTND